MDPDQTLLELRELIALINREEAEGHVVTDWERQLVDQISALDQFLSTGGFPPARWVAPIPVNEGRH